MTVYFDHRVQPPSSGANVDIAWHPTHPCLAVATRPDVGGGFVQIYNEEFKDHWLAPNWRKEGTQGNDITRTNIPDIRSAFRFETLTEELTTIYRSVKNMAHRDSVVTAPKF